MTVKTRIPKGWVKTGAKENNYIIGTIEGISHSGSQSGYIQSKTNANGAFGTLMQGVEAKEYIGSRFKLTGWIKTEEVTGWAGMWLRVDGDKRIHKKPLEFDNMHDRPIAGTTDWAKYEIELPVSVNATAIAFGAILCGAGKVYCDDFQIDYESSTKFKDSGNESDYKFDFYVNERPVNLNFQE